MIYNLFSLTAVQSQSNGNHVDKSESSQMVGLSLPNTKLLGT